jgi:adenylate cyclase
MARGYYMAGQNNEVRGLEATVRLCARAIEIDPAYAQAWGLMAFAQTALHSVHDWPGESGLAAAERALSLDPRLASAHAAKARHLWLQGKPDEARAAAQTALSLDPESWEVNTEAGRIAYLEHRFDDAILWFEKATALLDTPPGDPGMLVSCYKAVGDQEGMKRAARITLERCERALAQDQRNGSARGFGVAALAALGEVDRARDWIYRALLVDPDNTTMRYNFACTASVQLRDADTALEVLGPMLEKATASSLAYAMADPDFDFIRDDPRFKAMVAAAEARLAAAGQSGSTAA